MGNVYKQLDCTSASAFSESLRVALVDKYGDDVIIHYNGDYLIFSCPKLSNKVLKLNFIESTYGTAYSSGVNITDSVPFHSIDYQFSTAHIVLGDSFIFITGSHIEITRRGTMIIGKTVGGKYIIAGAGGYKTRASRCKTVDVSNNKNFDFVDFNTDIKCDTNTPYKTTLLINYIDDEGQSLMLKDDVTPDTIDGLVMSTYSNIDGMYVALPNALLSCRRLYTFVETKTVLHSSIMAEF